MTPHLIWSFVRQDLIDRYAGSVLGGFWAILQPLLMVSLFALVFGHFMAARLPGVDQPLAYSTYLMAGLLPWTAFANTLQRTATLFTDKRHILSKVGLPLTTLPLHVIVAELVTLSISLGVLALFMALTGQWPTPYLVTFPWVLVTQLMLAVGIGLIMAVIHVFVRDIREINHTLLQILFWLTPVVWTPSILSPSMSLWLAALNPVFHITQAYHAMVLPGFIPNYSSLAMVTVLAAFLLAVGYLLVVKAERHIRDLL